MSAERDAARAIEVVAGALRSGLTLVGALRECAASASGAVADEVAVVVADVEEGRTLEEALARWRGRDAAPWVATITDVATIGSEMGAGLPEALERLALGLRAEADLRDELRVLTAPARASVGLMLAMPVAFTGAVVLPDPAMRGILFGTPWGTGALAVALLAVGAGAVWMRSLVRSVW